MNPATRDDYFWLTTPEAESLLQSCTDSIVAKENIVRIAKSLRKKITPTRSALILELAQIRLKAKVKFSLASRMYFTRRGYEQATGELMARYKARRYSYFDRVADVCCGIGGDLQQLATRSSDGETVGIDQDSLMCLFASRNVSITNAADRTTLVESEFEDFDIRSFDALHFDPDRRVRGRTIHTGNFQPSLDEILRIERPKNIGVKLAPASPRPAGLPENIEFEWIGTRRECKQQLLWTGALAEQADCLTATTIEKDGSFEQISIREDEIDQTIMVASEIGPYLFEPHPAVLAGKLTDPLANLRKLARVAPGVAYLTGERPPTTQMLSTFKIITRLSLNVKDVISELKRQDAGQIQVKRRGVEQVVADEIENQKFDGEKKLTVILTRHKKRGVALVAKRIRGNRHSNAV